MSASPATTCKACDRPFAEPPADPWHSHDLGRELAAELSSEERE